MNRQMLQEDNTTGIYWDNSFSGLCVQTHVKGNKWVHLGYFHKDDVESAIETANVANRKYGHPEFVEDGHHGIPRHR